MTVLRNNFDGGPDGTTITTTNSAQGGDPFDSVNTASSTLKYSVANNRATAEYVMRAATAATPAEPKVTWSTSMGAQSQIWLRYYAYYQVVPTSFTSHLLFHASSGGTYCTWIGVLTPSGKLFLSDATTANFVSTANTIIAGTWMRVEARIQFSTTVGNAELRYYEEPDSDTPTETLTVSNYNMGAATANTFSFGYVYPDDNLEDFYVSGLEINNLDWPGPAPYKVKGVPGIQPSPVAIHNW